MPPLLSCKFYLQYFVLRLGCYHRLIYTILNCLKPEVKKQFVLSHQVSTLEDICKKAVTEQVSDANFWNFIDVLKPHCRLNRELRPPFSIQNGKPNLSFLFGGYQQEIFWIDVNADFQLQYFSGFRFHVFPIDQTPCAFADWTSDILTTFRCYDAFYLIDRTVLSTSFWNYPQTQTLIPCKFIRSEDIKFRITFERAVVAKVRLNMTTPTLSWCKITLKPFLGINCEELGDTRYATVAQFIVAFNRLFYAHCGPHDIGY